MTLGLQRLAPLAGLVGASVIGLGSVATAIAYSGTKGEGFSPLTHWVSELGQLGVSALSTVFNASLMFGGICFVIFMLGLGLVRRTWLAWIYAAIGVVAGVAGFFVGVYPMNFLDKHGLAALTFFNLGWIAVGLASIDFYRRPDPRFPRWLAIIGALTVVAFIGFLSVLLPLISSGAGLGAPDPRPEFWIVSTLEWAVLIGILAWVFATAWTWWRARR